MNTVSMRKKRVILLGAAVVFTLFLWFQSSSNFSRIPPTIQIIRDSEGAPLKSINLACQHPELPLNNPDIDKFFHDVPPLECDEDGQDWMTTFRSTAYVTEAAKSKFAPMKCDVTELLRGDEFQTVYGKTVVIDENEVYFFTETDYVEVKCVGRRGSEWKSFLAAPRQNLVSEEKESKVESSPHAPLNLLVWGQDSLSRLMFMRKLRLTWSYLQQVVHPVVLKGYNIVGDGTPQALTPILTGKTELELPEARSEMGDKAQHVDVYPFIWNEFKEMGYLTGFLEDQPTTGCFSHRHKGFDKTPTDFYMRIYFLAVDSFLYPVLTKVFSYIWPNYCIAHTPTHQVMMNYVKNIILAYRDTPKFLFAFRSEQSHNDVNGIQAADGDLKHFLEDLNSLGTFNDSIVIIMSDHGARFQSIRESQQGKLEERLPAFMFTFPSWFPKIYPIAHRNFLRNSERLVTPFDIHRTMQDIYRLGHDLKDEVFWEPNRLSERGMSLFREIPANRTCKDADIEPHWCACLTEQALPVDDSLVQRAAEEFVRMLNSLTEPHRSLCTPLVLGSVMSATRLIPSEELLKFRYSADRDGRVPDMADSTAISNMIIQLKVETSPNGGRYEVTMNYDRYESKFFVKERDISRINKYGSQADCVAHKNELSYLRKYCYCRTTAQRV